VQPMLPGDGGAVAEVPVLEPLQTILPGDEELAVAAQVAMEAEVAEEEAEQVGNDAAIAALLQEEETEDEEDEEADDEEAEEEVADE